MIEAATRELEAILLPVNNALGDRIVKAWLKLHMAWAKDAYDKAVHEEDKIDARADFFAFNRVLQYAGGEFDD